MSTALDDAKRLYMLIHGHNLDISLLPISQELNDLAVFLATNEEYDKTNFVPSSKTSQRLLLKDSKMFLQDTFRIHNIPYCDDLILRLRAFTKVVNDPKDIVKAYNELSISLSPFRIPIKFINESPYYGNLLFQINYFDDEEQLKEMQLFVKGMELSKKRSELTSVCYTHEIVHTQLVRNKFIIDDYYNVELLSIFCELMYSYRTSKELFKEVLKNRINVFLEDYLAFRTYAYDGDKEKGEWDTMMSCKYIVSTVKAFNLFNMYLEFNDSDKKYVISLIQDVFDGVITLEEMLKAVDVTYENSLKTEHVLGLIRR